DDRDAIEATVQQLLDNARAATGKRGISLPASVSAAKVTVAPVIDLAHCRGEVLIARDRVRVSHGHGCVILCPGAVEVAHGSRNVIVAGQYLDVSFDNAGAGRLWGSPDRSVLIAGRSLRVAFDHDTLCVPGRGNHTLPHSVHY